MTENHNYNTPSKGTQDWHNPLNTNFTDLDTDVEIRDTGGNRSSYTASDGAKFLATDRGIVSFGDGSSWSGALALLRYLPPSDSDDAGTLVAGHASNSVDPEDEVVGATISGGGYDSGSIVEPNQVFANYCTIGGGRNNKAGFENTEPNFGPYATVSGGRNNKADGEDATIGGGNGNVASGIADTVAGGLNNTSDGSQTTIGGGRNNKADRNGATIGGGFENTASGLRATVPGGGKNEAFGDYSFAAGRKATAGADGAFVWGDDSTEAVKSFTDNEFKAQAGGGVVFYSSSDLSTGVNLDPGEGSWDSNSSRSLKTDIDPVDPSQVLRKVENLDVSTWEYDSESEATHMGPMAEDFHAAFGLGPDAKHISTVDADGVAFAAIQGLAERKGDLETEVEDQQERLDEQAETIEDLREENEALQRRLDGIEQRVAELESSAGQASDAGGTVELPSDD